MTTTPDVYADLVEKGREAWRDEMTPEDRRLMRDACAESLTLAGIDPTDTVTVRAFVTGFGAGIGLPVLTAALSPKMQNDLIGMSLAGYMACAEGWDV